jgi:hypothetical protein
MKKISIAIILLAWVTITIAQKRKLIEVYLIAGQSNATGQGYVANMSDTMKVDRKVLIFHSGKPHLNSGLAPFEFAPLHQASESPDRFGPELGLGTTLQKLKPQSHIGIIKHAHSGTDLYNQWNPGKSEQDTTDWGVQFKVLVQTVNSGMDSLRKRGYAPTIKGMLWQQGENDADRGDSISLQYGKNLVHFIKRVRQQFKAPKMMFVYGYVYPPPNAGKGITNVRQAEHDIDQDAHTPLSVKRAFVVSTDDLSQRSDDPNTPYPKDHVHFGTKGTWGLGVRMAEMIAAKSTLN